MPDETAGPFLQLAVICEKVLQEAAGNLSIIRITDSLGVAGMGKEMQPQPIMLYFVVSFKAGFAHGKYNVKIVGKTPSKHEFTVGEQSPYFEGEDRGVNLLFMLNIVLAEEGVFWFDVLLQDILVTRVPLRVVYQQIAAGLPFGPTQSR